jgi:hypothetical protein
VTTQGIDIPVKIEGNDALIMLARIVNALEGVGSKAQAAAPKAEHLAVSLRGVGEAARHINEVRELVTSFAESLINAAERVGQLAGEQQRLDANSARLGLNFQQAAQNAGGFVSEMQTMTLATALANRNIRVTQGELDSLARVGMARAVSAGKNVEEVFDSIGDSIIEGGEELEKFGSSLHSVADESHTASERLTALVQRGNETARTMSTAADDVARFRNELQQAGRYISTGFVDEMARLRDVTGTMRDGARDAAEFRREMDAIGRTAALMLTGIGNAAGIIIGGIATSVSVMVAGIAAAQAGLHALATRGDAAAAARAAFESFGTRDVAEFTRNRVAGFGALFTDAGGRATAPAPAQSSTPASPDMVITAEEIGIDPRTGRPIRRASGGGGSRNAPRRATIEELMGRAFERTGARAELPTVVRDQTPEQLRASGERIREGIRESREADQRKGREAYERSDEGAQAFTERERTASREQRMLEERRDQYRTFTDEMEQLSARRINVAREEAEFVNGSFQAMGRAFATHLTAFVEGREELGTALQGMLADTLKMISEEAAVKAGLNLAGGFAALATYRYDAAAQHFAAAGIFTAVAAASGVAGAALTPQAKGASSAPSGGGNERDRSAAPMSQGSTTGGGTTVINVAFNGPQFGTGGVVQAARQLAGVLNAGAVQGGVQINRLALAGAR